jgi:hypothetical protein
MDTQLIAQPLHRVRINVSRTTKGVKTYECTIERGDCSIDVALAESDRLVAALDQRYGLEGE